MIYESLKDAGYKHVQRFCGGYILQNKATQKNEFWVNDKSATHGIKYGNSVLKFKQHLTT